MGDNDQAPSLWGYHNPVKIISGHLDSLSEYAPEGERILLVTTAGFVTRGITERLQTALSERHFTVLSDIKPNPDLEHLDKAVALLQGKHIDLVIALGGGSALDAGKALSLALPSHLSHPLAQVFHDNTAPAWSTRLPLLAIPTTAGTGAEVTPFATVWDHQRKRKHSLAGPLVFPDIAFLDVSLTLTLPEEETLYPGLDAMSHALESLWNHNCTPVSRALAMQSLALSAVALPGVMTQPDNVTHRANMQSASLLAGLAISQTRTAIAHAISYPLTTHYKVPHGLACSFTLATLLKANIGNISKSEYERLLLKKVLAVLEELKPGKFLSKYLTLDDLLHLSGEMFTPGRSENYLGANPINLESILRSAFGHNQKNR